MRPVIRALERRGAQVLVTARDFAQTLGLCDRLGIAHEAIGHHRGGGLAAKGAGLASRSLALAAGPRAAASTPRSGTAPTTSASPPSCSGSRARRRSTTSGRRSSTASTAGSRGASSCPTRSRPSGSPATAPRPQAAPLPGAQGGVLPRRLRAGRGGARRARARPPPTRSRSCARRRPSRSTTASSTRCSRSCSSACASRPRSSCSRARPSSARSWRPRAATSSPSARSTRSRWSRCADVVVSAGGTMNREAVALGTPVWTTFEGRLGAVDERLIAEGRLRRLARADDVEVVKRGAARSAARARAARSGALHRPAGRRPDARSALARFAGRIPPMRRRIRSAAALPFHRHSLPQVAVDAGLVALAYYLAYLLRFDGDVPALYSDLFERTLGVRDRRQRVRVRAVRPLPALDALRVPARLPADRAGLRRSRRSRWSPTSRSCSRGSSSTARASRRSTSPRACSCSTGC